MMESPGTGDEYARIGGTGASAATISRRGILLWGGLTLTVLVSVFVSLGLWQWNKYAAKTALQLELDERSRGTLIEMPNRPASADLLRYRHVELTGTFEGDRQILIDNRIDPTTERAGYHVITPLKLAGSDMRVLVNRGWVPASPDRKTLPDVAPPIDQVYLTGIAIVPGTKYFTLGGPQASGWEPVWQNLDLARFTAAAPWPMQPVVVQLDAETSHGYVRHWPRPDERADKHLSYALQWFGFAASSAGIWLYFLLRRHR